MDLSKFLLYNEQGEFGKILTDGNTVVKFVPKNRLFEESNELLFLERVKRDGKGSSYVVDLLKSVVDDSGTYIQMPFYNRGNLLQYKDTEDFIPYKWYICMLESIYYIHNLNIIHRDIKPENWLITEEDRLILTDFKFAIDANNSSKQRCGSIVYIAPEVLFYGDSTLKADIWSMGMTFYMLTFHMPPWQESENINTQKQWLKNTKNRNCDLPYLKYLDEKLCNIITHALVYNKNDRPSAEECINML